MEIIEKIKGMYRRARGEETQPINANPKIAFTDALSNALPHGLLNFIDIEIPAMRPIETPVSDLATGIIAQGILAENINEILCLYEGCTLLEIPLHVGQKNAVLQAQLLASVFVTRQPRPYIDSTVPEAAAALRDKIKAISIGIVPAGTIEGILTDAKTLKELVEQEEIEGSLPLYNIIDAMITRAEDAAAAATEEGIEIGSAALRNMQSLASAAIDKIASLFSEE
jgi:hypothetical protein